MRAYIAKRYSFQAAHQLPLHDGKCARPHGHSYTLAVELYGPVRSEPGHPKDGMVLDYAELDAAAAPLLDALDHRDLNVALPADRPTTAECIAAWIFRELEQTFGQLLWQVTVCETDRTEARIRASDLQED